tara:strand:+ start:231 stop:1469 length:1239 start_codon:yes stop_codon:yes gene_type:complete
MKIFSFKKLVAIIFLSIFLSCTEETILYEEIENDNNSLKSITLDPINTKVYQALPNYANNSKLFFGNEKDSEHLFSLVKMTLFSGNIPPTSLIDLLSDSIQVDSAMVYFQTADSLISQANLSLFSITSDRDSIFSDSTNSYTLDNYINYEENSLLISELPLSSISPDSTGFDSLKFLIKDENLDNLKNYFLDTENYPARTFMLKIDQNLDQIFKIESKESPKGGGKMRVWYKAIIDEQTTLDTFITFFTEKDITVFDPPVIENDDMNFITLNSGSGLRTIIEFDLSLIDSLSRNQLFKNSNLVLNVENTNFNEDDDFNIVVTALQDSVIDWTFSSFLDENDDQENLVINSNFIISRKIIDNKVEIPIQAFLQGYKNGLFTHNELMLYSSSVNNPFDKVKLNLNPIEALYVEP